MEAPDVVIADESDIPLINKLAHSIWPNAYSGIISQQQINYMLEMMYSPSSLQKQMSEEGCVFLIIRENDNPVGFASYAKQNDDEYKLHKLYVLTDLHGKGLGRQLLERVIQDVKSSGAKALILQVNKNNKAIKFYERMGFSKTRDAVFDIGNGFVMDDYIMTLAVNP